VSRMIRRSALALVFVATGTLSAQEAPAPPQGPTPPQAAAPQAPSRPATAETSRPAPVPLKIQLVLSRFQGEKKVSSVPYTLSVTANDGGGSAKVRMGVQMPIVSTVFGAGGTTTPTSYNYKDLSTNIDCNAASGTEGRYKVQLTVNDTSVYFPEPDAGKSSAATPPSPLAGVPAFRTFTSTFTAWLRDGQTSQYTSVTDQVSGQVLKIDATLTVLK
jgi:hypothetical protein